MLPAGTIAQRKRGSFEIAVAALKRTPQGLVVQLAFGLAGHPPHDLAEDEAAGDGVVGELAARAPDDRHLAEDAQDLLGAVEKIEVEGADREVRQPGAVGEDVAERDPLLAAQAELGDVLADGVVEAQQVPLVEEVDDHRGHGLGGGEEAEGGVGRRGRRGEVGRVVGAVACRVADRAVDQDLPVVAHAERDRGMDAAPVEILDGAPDARDRGGVDAGVARVDLGAGADGRDGLERAGHPAAGHERQRRHGEARNREVRKRKPRHDEKG
jgi:hypothetical protein